MTFYMDGRYQSPRFRAADETYNPLGEWVIADISRFFLVCLDALAMIDDVTNGREPFEEWDSENYEVDFSSRDFTVRNQWVENWGGRYPIDTVREVVEGYWRFLVSAPERDVVREYRPDLPEWEADLLRWEEKWDRRHPYRGRFF
jgi:hypothetical protein